MQLKKNLSLSRSISTSPGMLVHRRSLPLNLSGFPNNPPVKIVKYSRSQDVSSLALYHRRIPNLKFTSLYAIKIV